MIKLLELILKYCVLQTLEIEEKIKDSQEKIKQIKAEGSSGGGLVKVILNGNSEIEKS